ncbi:hypothetical protein BaOVIS_025000 [Babesia ovis]|uniref:Hpc2-related domain-containing protein n=1 Tax=Babesia ovis TaxID=5869 RepID=A0A9W5TCD5_BABOV|nr:hypothetical protein BaOVIS_025000 [Babesia ovis]
MSGAGDSALHPGKQCSIPGPSEAVVASTESNVSANGSQKVAKTPKASSAEEELIEQDLSEEEDSLHEPFVQRYKPGVSVEVKLKTVQKENSNGVVQQLPMIINFYEECLKTYRDDRLFIYEEGYLAQRKDPANDAGIPDRATVQGSHQADDTKAEKQADHNDTPGIPPASAEVSLDDVMWINSRPNDPLLRCIQSITDRLNIQGLVGDPTSYLKIGGDDMHYDIDDPFIDDDDMFSELRLSRDELLHKKQMEKDFSVWSEDEEDTCDGPLQPMDFISQYASKLEIQYDEPSDEEDVIPLFFNPAGWRHYIARVPKPFHPIFNELESTYKSYQGQLNNSDIRQIILDLLASILARLTKIQEPRPRKAPSSEGAHTSENKDAYSEQVQLFERRGLDCVSAGKIISPNGRILRWIVATICEVTNAVSCRDLHEHWLKMILAHNEQTIAAMRSRMAQKLVPKIQQLRDKKGDKVIQKLADNLRNLSKSVGAVRRLMRDYEVAIAAAEDATKSAGRKNVLATENVKQSKNKLQPSAEFDTPCSSQDIMDQYKCTLVIDDANIAPSHGFGIFGTPSSRVDSVDLKSGRNDVPERDTTSDHDMELTISSQILPSQKSDTSDGGILTLDDLVLTQSDPVLLKDDPMDNSGTGDTDDRWSFAVMMRQWSMWKRVSQLVSLYKSIAGDILAWVQMINIATAAQITIAGTDFKSLVEGDLAVDYIFDKAYIRIADLFSTVVQEVTGIKLVITPDVSRIVVMYLHETSTVDDLFERENEVKLVFFTNSDLCASPGIVYFTGPKKPKKASSSKLSKVPTGSTSVDTLCPTVPSAPDAANAPLETNAKSKKRKKDPTST